MLNFIAKSEWCQVRHLPRGQLFLAADVLLGKFDNHALPPVVDWQLVITQGDIPVLPRFVSAALQVASSKK